MPLQLFIGNKNYSSWSMRPWVLMRQAGIPFEEVLIRFDSFEADSVFKQRAKAVNPLGKVPALVDDGFAVWDSLAIAEYLAEHFPDKQLWPADARQRARARSVCAEMHSGFSALRNHCPMNIESMWGELLAAQPADGLLFGQFTIADAFFAPVCTRIRTYALPVSAPVRAYVDRVLALPGVKAWIDDALAERDFIDFDEPYRLRPATR